MNDVVRWGTLQPATAQAHRRELRSGLLTALGGLVMVAALAVGAAVAVLFAATLAVIMALATALLALSALAWRVKPRPAAELARIRAGHAWIAYGWERRRR